MTNTLYIEEAPATIPCWYCGETCYPTTEPFADRHATEYRCLRHEPLDVMFRCVKHDIPSPNVFFNTVRITLKDMRLDHNFYAGPRAYLEWYRPAKDRCWGGEWRQVKVFPVDVMINTDLHQVYSLLNLYKVWS